MIILIVGLFVLSAMISGSEVAFFSLKKQDFEQYRKSATPLGRSLFFFSTRVEQLLATILIANNFVNVTIIILVASLTHSVENSVWGYIVSGAIVTVLLLLFGEIVPKYYAIHFPKRLLGVTAYLIYAFFLLFYPLSYLMSQSTTIIQKRLKRKLKKKDLVSMEDISHALDITTDDEELNTNRELLEGVIRFTAITADQVMTVRVDMTTIADTMPYREVLSVIEETKFSRIPVYQEKLDNIKGILFVKDLLEHLDKGDDFEWQKLVRPAYIVPESKKIDDLLQEFRTEKTHIAIVIDEYGGCAGLITLDNVLESIMGKIGDDEDELYEKIEPLQYIFDGKMSLTQFAELLDISTDEMGKESGDADSLAGFLLELKQGFPLIGEVLEWNKLKFVVEEKDRHRITKIKVIIDENHGKE